MRRFSAVLPLFLGAALAISGIFPLKAQAQELRAQQTPFSVWLDFKVLSGPSASRVKLPVWLRSIESDPVLGVAGETIKTDFRLHFRRFDELQRELLVRVIYDDVAENSITVSGWSETGTQRFARGPFGSGLNLPSSDSMTVPMEGVDYIDVEAKGEGTAVRGVFLSWLRTTEVRQTLDFVRPAEVADPFENLPSSLPPVDDLLLAGRVRATIDAGQARLTPREAPQATWEFELASPPFMGSISFEILNADPLTPLEVLVNEQSLGPASVRTPDLADPGYRGVVRPLDRGVQFRYAGWLQAQKAVPGSALHPGVNTVVLRLPAESGPVAVRFLELQLKNQWQTLNRSIAPTSR